ncbi:MAG: hypothetical protein ABI844_00040 [Saprospiraceae bacterium]
MKYFLILTLQLFILFRFEAQPNASITNGIIDAGFYLPDVKDGYYRGARFDWSGVMPALSWNGHTYFGQWFDSSHYSPTLHDAIMGPVEAFDPIGYNEANVGEKFLKIGIGMITKPQEEKYFFANPYQIVKNGKWKVKKHPGNVIFTHKLKDQGYGYSYKKTVSLVEGKPELEIAHTLKNTGQKTLEGNVFNHNFFVMDKQITGPDFEIIFPFKPEGVASNKDETGNIEGHKITFSKVFSKNDHLQYAPLTGYGNSSDDYDLRIENHHTGAGVRIIGDKAISKFVFWSAEKTLSPEPYIHIKVEPGQEISWKISYQFYECTIN